MALQYVVLEHTVGGKAHFDLLLEVEGQERLRTLQLPQWPLQPGGEAGFTELPAHRRLYLTFDGELSGGRGRVRRVESGLWTPGPDGSFRFAATQGDAITLVIAGSKVRAL
jgi:hypothetical protein